MQFYDLIGDNVIGYSVADCPLCRQEVATNVFNIASKLYNCGALAERVSRKKHPDYLLVTDPVSGEKVCEKCLHDKP